MKSAAVIYIILAVITIFLFVLTRPVNLRIAKGDCTIIGIEFTLFAIQFTKTNTDTEENKSEDTAKGETPMNAGAIFSLFAKVFDHIGKCGIRIHKLIIPKKKDFSSFWTYFRYMRWVSILFAYIDSRVENLIIDDNAFILSPDKEKVELDVTFRMVLFDLFTLGRRLIFEMIKLGKIGKRDVGN